MLVPMGCSIDFLAMADWRLFCPHCGQDAIRPRYRTLLRHDGPNKKAPPGLFSNSHSRHQTQCASAQTFFLVKYIKPAKMIRNTNTCKPNRLRASMCGSAVQVRNVVTSWAYCATVAGDPSSNVTWPSLRGFGILMAWPGKYLL